MSSVRPLHKLSDIFNSSLAISLRHIPALEGSLVGCSRLFNSASGVPLVEIIRERLRRAVCHRATALGNTYREVNLPSGARMVVDITSSFGCLYFDGQQSYEQLTTKFVMANLPRGGTFVDIGANVGYLSLLAAGLVGSNGKVYAFEPNTQLHDKFMRSVRANSFEDRIQLSEAALSNIDAERVDFFLSQAEANSGLSSLTPNEDQLSVGNLSLSHKISVPSRTFDSWIEETGITNIDLLKIDVEGAEEMVLEGMRRTLTEMPPPHIIIETNLNGPVTKSLNEYGYSATCLDPPAAEWGNILYTSKRV